MNTTGLCGASDWRMPTRKELQGLADYGQFNPAIDGTYFVNTTSWFHWSGSPLVGNSSTAWGVHFLDGYASGAGYRMVSYQVRLVRGGP